MSQPLDKFPPGQGLKSGGKCSDDSHRPKRLHLPGKSPLPIVNTIQFLTADAFVKKDPEGHADLQGPIFLLVTQVEAFSDTQITWVVGLA
jgi:hypothetical protein